MKIVGNSFFLRKLRNLDFFELDLGKSKKLPGEKDEWRKLDDFILRYKGLYERDIRKFGKISNRIIFYEDLRMPENLYLIFKDEDIYEIPYKDDEISDMKNYILDTLRKVDDLDDEQRKSEEKNITLSKEAHSNEESWVADDEKNRKNKI